MAPVLLGRSVMGFSTPDRIDASRGRALSRVAVRPRVHGKFLYVGDEKLLVRGVTYGPFRPDATGREYHDAAPVERDLAAIAANGLTPFRTSPGPPPCFSNVPPAVLSPTRTTRPHSPCGFPSRS